MHRFRSVAPWLGAVALLAGALVASPAAGQRTGDGFLFREPTLTLALRGGFDRAGAESDLFAFSTEQLTLSRGDFDAPAVGGDLVVRLAPRLALALGASYAASRADSEFRDWVDQDDRPIEQTTRFQRLALTASGRFYLAPRGRSVGRLAWIPARAAPYVGAGAGALWYRFRQEGDFVDFQTSEVFGDVLESTGWAPVAQLLAGADVSLTPRLGLTGEARYLWGQAEPNRAFRDFDEMDLSGASLSLGLTYRH